jgi:hypothetical protein
MARQENTDKAPGVYINEGIWVRPSAKKPDFGVPGPQRVFTVPAPPSPPPPPPSTNVFPPVGIGQSAPANWINELNAQLAVLPEGSEQSVNAGVETWSVTFRITGGGYQSCNDPPACTSGGSVPNYDQTSNISGTGSFDFVAPNTINGNPYPGVNYWTGYVRNGGINTPGLQPFVWYEYSTQVTALSTPTIQIVSATRTA